MASPVKALTYLTGTYPATLGAVLPVRPLTLSARQAIVLRLMPPRWRGLTYRLPQPMARTVLIPRPVFLHALAAVRLAIFWRSAQGLPMKGQRYPLSR